MTPQLRSALAYVVFLVAISIGLDLAVGSYAASRDASFRAPHPYYHHGLLPEPPRARPSWGGRPYAMRTDSLGFRDADEARDRAPRRAGAAPC